MSAGEWIALAALIVTILGAAATAIWHMSSLNSSVKSLTKELSSFRHFVMDEHRDIWAAINKKADK